MPRGRSVLLRAAWFTSLLVVLLLAAVPSAQAIKAKPSTEAKKHAEVVLISGSRWRPRLAGRATGVLIAPNAVLTAAHAVEKFDTWEVVAPYARNGAVRRAVQAIRVHPKFHQEAIENDLAVLILRQSIEIPGKYPTLHGGGLYPIDTRLVVVGRVDNGTLYNNRTFRANLTLVAFRGNVNVYGGHPQTVEEGDSGGPVYAAGKEDEVAAVVSGKPSSNRLGGGAVAYLPSRRRKANASRTLPKACSRLGTPP